MESEVQRLMHLFMLILTLMTTSPFLGDSLQARALELQITEAQPFKYELFLSDVHCWIERSCAGLVSNYEKRDLALRLEKILSETEKSADFALFGLRNQKWFLDQITNLKKRGVAMRFTLDQLRGHVGDWETKSNFIYPDGLELVKILGAKLVLSDVNKNGTARTGSLMHHKFFILDDKKVWLGSTNLSDTETGAEYNANASILVESSEIAKTFKGEMDQMFDRRRYSIYKTARPTIPRINFSDGTKVKILFAPQESPITTGVIPFIQGAKTTLDVGIFYLTDVQVAQELILAKNRGVKVRVINDATAASNQYSQNDLLRENGIDVRVENWGGKMHMKSAVRDHRDTIIASANWTQAGNNQNDEHFMIIENNTALAAKVSDYFHSLWEPLASSLNHAQYRSPRAEGHDSINSCEDGIDNDHNEIIDQDSPACR